MIYVLGIEGHTPVKIGCVKGWSDVEQRRQALQIGCPYVLTVLATCPGDLDYERFLHNRFHSFSLRGEWFDIPEEVVPAWDDLYLAMTLFDAILIHMGYEFPPRGDWWPTPIPPEGDPDTNQKGVPHDRR
jgi:hypothetical protein